MTMGQPELGKRTEAGGRAGADPRPSRSHIVLVALLLLAGASLRLVALDRYPAPLHQDELSDIYDGYSLATTGRDRWGEPWPILFYGMGPGDYHPGMYAYLAACSTKLFGFSVWAGRLPAAMAGILSIALVYLVARRLMGRNSGAVALALVSFSPIHIQYSRLAHQGVCLMPLFVILLVYLCLRVLDAVRDARSGRGSPWGLIAACGFAIGFSTHAYSAMRLIGLLFAILATALVVVGGGRASLRRAPARIGLLALACAVGAAPQLWAAIAHPDEFLVRGRSTVVPITLGRLHWVSVVLQNLAANLDPRYLFLSFGEHEALSVARLSAWTLPFVYVGLALALVMPMWRRELRWIVLPFAICASLLPAVITKGQPSPMRSSGMWVLYPIVAALGVVMAARLLQAVMVSDTRAARWRGTAVGAVACLVVAALGTVDLVRYVRRPELHAAGTQPALIELGRLAAGLDERYDRVYVEADGLFPYLYIAAFSGMTPAEFQTAERSGEVIGLGWDDLDRLGHFRFGTLEEARRAVAAADPGERWIVLRDGRDAVELLAGASESAVATRVDLTPTPARTQ